MASSRFTTTRTLPMTGLAALLWLLPTVSAHAQATASAIKLLISPEEPFVAEPNAARIVLQIHNSSPQAIWLYRRAKGKRPPQDQALEENKNPPTTGSATVEVKLQPADAELAKAAVSPAEAMVLEYVQMPKPRLVKLAAGDDYKEVSILHLAPALSAGQKPIWGAYRLTATYGGSFSNGEQFQRNLGVTLWQDEVTSNAIDIELRPPLPDAVGVVSGSAVAKDLQPRAGIRVSLSDENGQLIDQQITAGDGRFSFAHLPLTLYWLTGRVEDAVDDTVTFRHEQLSGAASNANEQLVFFPQEIYEAKKLVHKPVLLRVFDPGHEPAGGIAIDAVFSNGEVIDDVKATSDSAGTATMVLLPGRSSVTLSRHACADQTEHIDVTPGTGVESFKFVFSCEKK